MTVAVLFARSDSVYKRLRGCDVWDIDRDARKWGGGAPVVAHPSCRAWGRLRKFAKPRPGEKDLALWAVAQVRKFGGVLEHPRGSTLWAAAGLPLPGERDAFGGWTLEINQHWLGHKAEKATWLYIVGCEPQRVPPVQMQLLEPTHVVAPAHGMRAGHPRWRPIVTKREREATPEPMARFLVAVAKRCRVLSARGPLTQWPQGAAIT